MDNLKLYTYDNGGSIVVNQCVRIPLSSIKGLPPTITTYNHACACILYMKAISECLGVSYNDITLSPTAILHIIER